MADVPCTTCGKPLVPGQLRRFEEHHECYQERHRKLREAIGVAEEQIYGRRRKRKNNRPPDIKAPDGYVLGGTRKVLKDGTIRLCGSYYQCPVEWAGQWRSVHINGGGGGGGGGGNETLDVAPEHVHIYVARVEMPDRVYVAQPADKADPKNRTVENLKRKGQWHMG